MLVGLLSFIVLVFLPGAWITFGLRLRGMPFWARLLCGAMLAPLIATVQFYLLRLLGVPFQTAAVLLVALNLPAAYLVLRKLSIPPLPDGRTLTAVGIIVSVILACIAPFLLDSQKRSYLWEIWNQADVVYSIANGELIPEDAELAGVRLSYPWLGHVFQSILSYLFGSPPVSNYIWTNLVWLVLIFGFAAGIVAELGGSRISQITVIIWLSFGVNFVGSVLSLSIPNTRLAAYPILGEILGDNRYTPWLDKTIFFHQMQFAIAFFIAIVFLMIKVWPDGFRGSHIILTGLLICGIGITYPVLLPPALAVIGARTIIIFSSIASSRRDDSYREVLGLGIVMLVAGVVTVANVRFLTLDRASDMLVSLNGVRFIGQRVVEGTVVTFPLLIGFVLVSLRRRKSTWRALTIMAAGALSSFALYTMFDIPWWRNEYKFIFTAAVCLAPFPSLALEPWLDRLGRMTLPIIAVLTLVMAAPWAYNIYLNEAAVYIKAGPPIDLGQFEMRLEEGERLAGLFDAISNRTPVNSLLVLDKAELHFPTLARRHLFVAPPQDEPYPGILITSDETLTLVKGYSRQIIEERRSIVQDLYSSHDSIQMRQALHRMLKFNRPLLLVMDEQRHSALLSRLKEEKEGNRLYEDGGLIVWMLEPEKL